MWQRVRVGALWLLALVVSAYVAAKSTDGLDWVATRPLTLTVVIVLLLAAATATLATTLAFAAIFALLVPLKYAKYRYLYDRVDSTSIVVEAAEWAVPYSLAASFSLAAFFAALSVGLPYNIAATVCVTAFVAAAAAFGYLFLRR